MKPPRLVKAETGKKLKILREPDHQARLFHLLLRKELLPEEKGNKEKRT
jgi:hypothetical protein